MEFESVLNVNEVLNKQLSNAAMELVIRAVRECGSLYKFDGEEAIQRLGLNEVRVASISMKKEPKEKKEKKSTFVLPYNGECDDNCCRGLKQNHGLYTQCSNKVKDTKFCDGCGKQAERNESGKPDYGTIEDRQAVPLMEFRDPKGKQPISYTKIMKKMNYSQEQVMEEAKKRGIQLNEIHFEEPKKAEKVEVLKEDKKKGRPKKSKKVMEVQGETNDLFAELIEAAQSSVDEELQEELPVEEEVKPVVQVPKKKAEKKSEEEKAADKAAKEAALKEKKEADKVAKEAALKEKKEAEKAAKEAEKAAKAAEKAAEKAAKKAAEKETKKVEKVEKKETPTKAAEEEEADIVKKFEFEGVKYLKSKKSGIIYNMEQEVVGKWNEETQKIDFDEVDSDEEEEDD